MEIFVKKREDKNNEIDRWQHIIFSTQGLLGETILKQHDNMIYLVRSQAGVELRETLIIPGLKLQSLERLWSHRGNHRQFFARNKNN